MSRTFGDAMLVLSAIPAVLSVIVFARVPWWKSPLGRHMMSYMVVMAGVLSLGCVRLAIGFVPAFETARAIIFAGVPFVMWWRLGVLVRAQTRGGAFNVTEHHQQTIHSEVHRES